MESHRLEETKGISIQHGNNTQELPLRIPDAVNVSIYICVISIQLSRFVVNSSLMLDQNELTVFDVGSIPRISIQDYLMRIMTYSGTSSRSLILSYMYIDRLTQKDKNLIKLTRFNVHRLLLVSIMAASKFYDDVYLSNKHWAAIGGVEVSDINRLERAFLSNIDYRMNMDVSEFVRYAVYMFSYANENMIEDQDLISAAMATVIDSTYEEIVDSIDE